MRSSKGLQIRRANACHREFRNSPKESKFAIGSLKIAELWDPYVQR